MIGKGLKKVCARVVVGQSSCSGRPLQGQGFLSPGPWVYCPSATPGLLACILPVSCSCPCPNAQETWGGGDFSGFAIFNLHYVGQS